MYLEIDQGNTRLKWRFEGTEMKSGSFEQLSSQLKKQPVRLIRLVSVCSHQRSQHLINNLILQSPQPIEWRIAASSAECMQVKNAYSNPDQLGVDRWSAVIAAATDHQCHGKAIAVLGCGSAVTIDLVDSSKNHLGGGIAPGFNALQQGLREVTNISFMPLKKLSQLTPGTNTQDAIEWGARITTSGIVNQILKYCNNLFSDNWQLILHGGDSALLAPYIDSTIDASFCPELVLDGLKYLTDDSKMRGAGLKH